MAEILITIALAWPIQNLIHEGAHALCAMALGYTVDEFKPWPHRHNGLWYFGRFSVVGSIRHAAIPVAPLCVAGALFGASLTCAIIGGSPIAIGIAIVSGGDAAWWMSGYLFPRKPWLDAQMFDRLIEGGK